MSVNLDGVVFGAHAVRPALRQRGGGAIVATASLAGLTGVALDPIYAANKHAVVGLTRCWARLWLREHPLQRDLPRVHGVGDDGSDPRRIATFGVPLIEASTVADAVVELLTDSDVSGSAGTSSPGAPRLPSASAASPGRASASATAACLTRACAGWCGTCGCR